MRIFLGLVLAVGCAIGVPVVSAPRYADAPPRHREGPRGRPPALPPALGDVAQTLSMAVRPGSLRVSPAAATFALPPDGRITLPRVRVLDARGDLAGWTLSLVVRAIDPRHTVRTRVRVTPLSAEVVDGELQGLVRARPSTTELGGTAPICAARAPGGGGTYACRARVDVHGGATSISVAFVASP